MSFSVPAHHTVAADEAEGPGQHLVAAGAVMGVQQDDLVRLAAVDLAGVAQAEHVLRMFALALVPATGLACHERHESFGAQLFQHVDGRDIGVALRTAVVLFGCEDRRRDARDFFIGERLLGPD
jgi:hypothetical protein